MSVAFDAPAFGRESPVAEIGVGPLTPTELENLIEIYRTAGTLDPDRDRRQAAFARMRELIAKRSTETITLMEARRGLRAP